MNRDRLKTLLSGGMSAGKSDDGGGDDPGIQAADAILKAVKAGSAEQLDMALRDHYEACEADHGDEADSGHDEESAEGE